jgi:hypothetical protein
MNILIISPEAQLIILYITYISTLNFYIPLHYPILSLQLRAEPAPMLKLNIRGTLIM